MATQHELSILQKELRRKNNEYEDLKNTSERWLADIQSKISEAKEYGLIKQEIPAHATKEDLVYILETVTKLSPEEAKTTEETISDALNELTGLRNEESKLSTVLIGLRKRLDEMTSLKEASEGYVNSLEIQKERLLVSKWLDTNIEEKHECPVCGNNFEEQIGTIKILVNTLAEVDENLKDFKIIPSSFEREYQRVKEEIRINLEKLAGVKIRIKNLDGISKEANEKKYISTKISRFIGNVEEGIKYYYSLGNDSELKIELEELQERVKELERKFQNPR